MASDAELARASVLTYKGHLDDSEKTFDELLKENLYLSGMLKQKEAQMEEAEKRWRQQFNEAMRRATQDSDEEEDNDEASDRGEIRPSMYPDVLPKVIARNSPNVL